MSIIQNAVYEFFEFHLGIYGNPHKVQIVMSPDGSIDMSSAWPVELTKEEEKLKLGYSGVSGEKFVRFQYHDRCSNLKCYSSSLITIA